VSIGISISWREAQLSKTDLFGGLYKKDLHPSGEIVARGRSLIESEDNHMYDETAFVSMADAAWLCAEASEAERAARLDGQPRSTGKSAYLAQLSSAKLAAMARYEKDAET